MPFAILFSNFCFDLFSIWILYYLCAESSLSRGKAEIRVVFRFCVWAFSRVEMVLTGCDLKRHSIFISVFIIHNRLFYEVDLALFVYQIESAPLKLRKSVFFSVLRVGVFS